MESNLYQRTADFPDELANGYHIMLDTEVVVTVRCSQVAPLRSRRPASNPLAKQKMRPRNESRGLFLCLKVGTPDGLRSHDLHLERVASWTRLDDRGTGVFYYSRDSIGRSSVAVI